MKKISIAIILLSSSFLSSLATASDVDGEKLFKSKTCVACHTIDNKMVGPSIKEIASKNAEVVGAVDTLALHIREGSSGVWGPIPMPRNAVTEEESVTLAKWVLSHK